MQETKDLITKIEAEGLWDKELSLTRGEYLKVQGSTDTNVYFIVEGSLRVFVIDEFEEHTIRFGYEHNIIVAMDSFIKETPSDLYIQALKKTKVKVISKKNIMALINSTESSQLAWVQILEQLLVQQLERERDLLIMSPVERYKRVLERSPQLFQAIPNKYIADYLRMTPETLSRIKKS